MPCTQRLAAQAEERLWRTDDVGPKRLTSSDAFPAQAKAAHAQQLCGDQPERGETKP
jgi:hypothetical protein